MALQSVYEAVVADFYDRVFADADFAPYFADTDRADLSAHQIQFISAVAVGPVEYTGAEMRESHAHLAITDRGLRPLSDTSTAPSARMMSPTAILRRSLIASPPATPPS
jgi:hypothetical protein